MFLLDPFYGYVQGDFTMEEDASPAKILLDLISVFNQINQDCQAKLQVGKVISVFNQINQDCQAKLQVGKVISVFNQINQVTAKSNCR